LKLRYRLNGLIVSVKKRKFKPGEFRGSPTLEEFFGAIADMSFSVPIGRCRTRSNILMISIIGWRDIGELNGWTLN